MNDRGAYSSLTLACVEGLGGRSKSSLVGPNPFIAILAPTITGKLRFLRIPCSPVMGLGRLGWVPKEGVAKLSPGPGVTALGPRLKRFTLSTSRRLCMLISVWHWESVRSLVFAPRISFKMELAGREARKFGYGRSEGLKSIGSTGLLCLDWVGEFGGVEGKVSEPGAVGNVLETGCDLSARSQL